MENTVFSTVRAGALPCNILLVEDEPCVREIMALQLVRLGYTVMAVADATTAIQEFQKQRGAIDLLITDFAMAEMNGHQLAQFLRRLEPQLRVIYISGYIPEDLAHEAGNCLQKPFGRDVLVTKLAEVMSRQPERPVSISAAPDRHPQKVFAR
jgi:CheY-like chemotaxis protein